LHFIFNTAAYDRGAGTQAGTPFDGTASAIGALLSSGGCAVVPAELVFSLETRGGKRCALVFSSQD
jgi:hypothetical protein